MKLPLSIFLLFFVTITTHAQIIHVPGDQPTIQAGIDAASDGDTVLADPGIYAEHINFNGKSITLASLCLVTSDTSYISQTVIDGDGWELPVVRAYMIEDSTTLLSGFTIRNSIGGGIFCEDAFVTIEHTRIINNSNWGDGMIGGFGGGIHNQGAMVLRNVEITGNHASWLGGGIFNAGDMVLENVNILNNSARIFGGGIYQYYK